MNIEETKAAIAVMQAFVDGKKIEYRARDEKEWEVATTPTWHWWTAEFRIAPAPVVREMTADDWRKLALSGVQYWVRYSGERFAQLRFIAPDCAGWEISFDLQTWQKPEVVDGKICGRV